MWPGGTSLCRGAVRERGHMTRYRLRTRMRRLLPEWCAQLFPRGTKDCGKHEWFRRDENTDECYHCAVGIRESQLDRYIRVQLDDVCIESVQLAGVADAAAFYADQWNKEYEDLNWSHAAALKKLEQVVTSIITTIDQFPLVVPVEAFSKCMSASALDCHNVNGAQNGSYQFSRPYPGASRGLPSLPDLPLPNLASAVIDRRDQQGWRLRARASRWTCASQHDVVVACAKVFRLPQRRSPLDELVQPRCLEDQ